MATDLIGESIRCEDEVAIMELDWERGHLPLRSASC